MSLWVLGAPARISLRYVLQVARELILWFLRIDQDAESLRQSSCNGVHYPDAIGDHRLRRRSSSPWRIRWFARMHLLLSPPSEALASLHFSELPQSTQRLVRGQS